ncbi:MAG: holo-ACP synthase [Pelolinea sp.]|nr:holo-ACP synthase [Pelolinea sp.]
MKPIIFSGIDLIDIDRFSLLDPSILKRFFTRVFTPEELEYIGKSHNRAAGIFAAKEAVSKALGCGIGPISWQDIIISHTPDRQPTITLLNKAREKSAELHIRQWSISITHTKKTAAAVAVAVAVSEDILK